MRRIALPLACLAALLAAVLAPAPAGAQEGGRRKKKQVDPRPENERYGNEKPTPDAPMTLGEIVDAAKRRWNPNATNAQRNLTTDEELRVALADEAGRHELAAVFLHRLVAIESSADKRTGKNRFGYAGLFQLGKAACDDIGVRYDEVDEPAEWRKNVEAGAKYVAVTRDRLARELARRKIERRLAAVDLYLAHQQGVTGCANLLEHVVKNTARTTDMTSAQLNNIDGTLKARLTTGGRVPKIVEFHAYWVGAFTAVEEAIPDLPPRKTR
jgi:hypothetical protein